MAKFKEAEARIFKNMFVCKNCGTKYSNGLCSNCSEEAYIIENQSEYIDRVSNEFADKANRQFDERKKRRKSERLNTTKEQSK